ncbi:hypothetical protein C8J57DRAFT_1250589 [Mycena rebaudengoi]|nr:hypothetical protein C8J57DRAFT_1250589 [Mycena rebaudengoi]
MLEHRRRRFVASISELIEGYETAITPKKNKPVGAKTFGRDYAHTTQEKTQTLTPSNPNDGSNVNMKASTANKRGRETMYLPMLTMPLIEPITRWLLNRSVPVQNLTANRLRTGRRYTIRAKKQAIKFGRKEERRDNEKNEGGNEWEAKSEEARRSLVASKPTHHHTPAKKNDNK